MSYYHNIGFGTPVSDSEYVTFESESQEDKAKRHAANSLAIKAKKAKQTEAKKQARVNRNMMIAGGAIVMVIVSLNVLFPQQPVKPITISNGMISRGN